MSAIPSFTLNTGALLDGAHIFNGAQQVSLTQCTINVSVAARKEPSALDTFFDTAYRPADVYPGSSSSQEGFGDPHYGADQAFQAATKSMRHFRDNSFGNDAYTILRTAVDFYALAYERTHKGHKYYLDIAINYGVALSEYARRTPDYAGPTVIDVLFKHAEEFSGEETKPKLYLMLLNNLGGAYINRFINSSNPLEEDLDGADRYFEQVRSCEPNSRQKQHYRSLVGSARVTSMRYNELTPNLAVFQNAINQVKEILDQHPRELEREGYQVLGDLHYALHHHGQHWNDPIGVQPPNLFHLNQAMICTEKYLSVLPNQDLFRQASSSYNLAKYHFRRHVILNRGSSSGHLIVDDLKGAKANLEKTKGLIQKEPQLLAHLATDCDDLERLMISCSFQNERE